MARSRAARAARTGRRPPPGRSAAGRAGAGRGPGAGGRRGGRRRRSCGHLLPGHPGPGCTASPAAVARASARRPPKGTTGTVTAGHGQQQHDGHARGNRMVHSHDGDSGSMNRVRRPNPGRSARTRTPAPGRPCRRPRAGPRPKPRASTRQRHHGARSADERVAFISSPFWPASHEHATAFPNLGQRPGSGQGRVVSRAASIKIDCEDGVRDPHSQLNNSAFVRSPRGPHPLTSSQIRLLHPGPNGPERGRRQK